MWCVFSWVVRLSRWDNYLMLIFYITDHLFYRDVCRSYSLNLFWIWYYSLAFLYEISLLYHLSQNIDLFLVFILHSDFTLKEPWWCRISFMRSCLTGDICRDHNTECLTHTMFIAANINIVLFWMYVVPTINNFFYPCWPMRQTHILGAFTIT